ncbi:cytochrome P450 [Mycotypha africana]|uniref:cytochrome P450 n=1 Tax=Mycotypha africana TaxID=64632 RepID=UPI002301AAA6|nr:cytochrome P450 [Mycotypha africana]KAI8982138.1 cytochrome P450 [Mycotypha africana]
MDFIITKASPPIQQALQIIQQSPIVEQLERLYRRSSRNELIFIGTATFLTLYNLSSYIKTKCQKLNAPPTVPFSLPLIGHTLYTTFMPYKFLDWCDKRYGEIYNLHLLGQTVTVANGKCGEETLKAERDDLSLEHGVVRDLLHLHYLFDDDGMEIAMQVNPYLLKKAVPNSRMRSLVPGIQRGLENAVHDLFHPSEPTIIKEPSEFFQDYVAYMSVPTLVGDEAGTNIEVIKSFAAFTGDIIKNVGLFAAVPDRLHKYLMRFMTGTFKHHRVMEKHLGPIVREHREKMRQAEEAGVPHGLEPTYLQLLIEWKKDDGVSGYTDKQICHALLSVAFASVHTTSTNLLYCISWLIVRPDLKEQLLEEIRRVSPGDKPVTYDELQQMAFLNNFVREVLRQGTDPLATGKKAMRDYTYYNGYQVPKGRLVQTASRQLNFGTNSTRSTIEEMDPTKSNNKTTTTPARDYVAFGMGKHLCPGRFFATQEIEMSLVYLLKNYDFNTVRNRKPYPITTIAGILNVNTQEPLIFTPKKKIHRGD